MPRPRLLKHLALALGTALLAVGVWDFATYDRAAWLADYARVKHDMARGYANLDWMVEERGIDLVALDRRTTSELESAHSRLRAFLALRRFLRAFADPHLRMQPGKRPAPGDTASATPDTAIAAAAPADPPAGQDCEAAGYEEGDHAFGLPVQRLAGWTPLHAGDFPAGLVGHTGFLRIAQLGEDRYLGACRAVFRPGIGAHALQLAVRARQQALLRRTLAALRAQGARRLVVDVTGNGGGSEWVSEVAALMTDRSLRREEPRLARPACDRGIVWRRQSAPCSVYAGPAAEATLAGTGAWRGPVLVAADAGTGSAAEDFVVWLQQNGVARVVGERTAGAGCGYVDGGTVTRLEVVPVDVMMPNCSRFLASGANEVEGIRPDLPIPLRGRKPDEVAKALAAALARAE